MPVIERRPQLITYPDSLGGTIPALTDLLATELEGLFPGGVHLLPPFPSTADRGFAPTRYDRIGPRFGTWADFEALAQLVPLTVDVMVNHVSRYSAEFADFERQGLASPHADMFLRPDKLWPDGRVPDDELRRMSLRRPDHPFLDVEIAATGTTERVWATFGSPGGGSDQIDLDWTSPLTRAKYDDWFSTLAAAGVAEIRLDAVGYLTKRPGSSYFMVEPEIWEVLDLFADLGRRHGLAVLSEVHAVADTVAGLDRSGAGTYDFVLPGLVLDALVRMRSAPLVAHLAALSPTRVTMLDCHDGVPIQPDLVGVLPTEDLIVLTGALEDRGANVNRILGAHERGIDFDAHQVNISYLDAAGGDDGLAVARAVQLFAPGRPQVYYQGLLGGGNDDRAMAATGEGPAVNRTGYTTDEVRAALRSDISRRQQRVLGIRSRHPAFGAERPAVEATGPSSLRIHWELDDGWCRLDADFAEPAATISMSTAADLEEGAGWLARGVSQCQPAEYDTRVRM